MLDEMDIKILALLQEDATRPVAEIDCALSAMHTSSLDRYAGASWSPGR